MEIRKEQEKQFYLYLNLKTENKIKLFKPLLNASDIIELN